MDVVVFGSAIVDFICYVPRLPNVGETLHGNSFATGFGGKGANQCVAAARLGAKTAMVAKLGGDVWGQKYVDHLQKENVNIDFIEVCQNESTGIAQISVCDSGDNSIIIVVGANNLLSIEDVDKASELFRTAKVLVCQLETPVQATIAALKAFHGVSILNAAPALEDTPLELLKHSSIFCVNESEAFLMTGIEINNIPESIPALYRLIEMGANTVIITLGQNGAVYMGQNHLQAYHVPTKKVDKVVDTTGAGDAFIGALSYYIASQPNIPLHQQIGAACEVAAYSVQYPGTQSSFADQEKMSMDFKTKQFEWNAISKIQLTE